MVILVACSEMMLRTRITETAAQLGLRAETARSASEIFERLRAERPRAIFLDLNSAPLQPIESLRTLRRSQDLEGVDVIAIFEHARADLGEQARTLGCERVLTRGQLDRALKELLADYA